MIKGILFSKVTSLVVRHALTAAGTYLVAEGYTDEATWQTVSGGAMAAVGIGLSVGHKALAGQIQLRF